MSPPAPAFRCAFFARDYEASVAFYGEALGLPAVERWERGADDRGTLFAAAAGIVEVLARPRPRHPDSPWDHRPPQGVILVIEVADVDGFHRRLVERGVVIEEGPTDQRWGHRSVRLRDPDGLQLYLFTPR